MTARAAMTSHLGLGTAASQVVDFVMHATVGTHLVMTVGSAAALMRGPHGMVACDMCVNRLSREHTHHQLPPALGLLLPLKHGGIAQGMHNVCPTQLPQLVGDLSPTPHQLGCMSDNEIAKALMASSTVVNVSVECAGMLERLLLAQLQECTFENTIGPFGNWTEPVQSSSKIVWAILEIEN